MLQLIIIYTNRLLGNNGSIVVQIATEVAGSPRGVKIRIRGIGSGFVEGNQQELQEPLHFNISAETPDMLVKAVEKTQALVSRVKIELEGGGMGNMGGMNMNMGGPVSGNFPPMNFPKQ